MTAKKNNSERMDKIVSLCKRKGFIFQSGEIYGGVNGCWDYGFLGVELKNNLKTYWWQKMVRERDDVVGMDGAILTHRNALKASGHVDTFNDPMVDCKKCKARFRADNIESEKCTLKPSKIPGEGSECELTPARKFNLMLKTFLGATANENDENAVSYLRPETAQSIFLQYSNILDTYRLKLPFGIAQIGKAFRNEINPRNYTFRSREFEQMEIEFFCKKEDGMKLTEEWLDIRLKFYEEIGLDKNKLKVLDVPDNDRAHYSLKTYDIEYEFPFGLQELEGVAYRTDHDLSGHSKHSGKSLDYFDQETKERFIPHVVEPSAGVDRTVLALICEAYCEEEITDGKGKKDQRIVMKFSPKMAPVKCAIFPLVKNNPDIVKKSREIYDNLKKKYNVFYDETGAVGRRYRRQDEIGTPFCMTIDFDTLGNEGNGEFKDTITIRDRDTMEQERIKIDHIEKWLEQNLI